LPLPFLKPILLDSAMAKQKSVQPGRYVTTSSAISDRCIQVGVRYEDLTAKTGLTSETIDHANEGGPSVRGTLQKIGDALHFTDWRCFLDADFHEHLKRDGNRFVDAVGNGEEFGALRRLGSQHMIGKSLAAPEVKGIGDQLKRLCKKTNQSPDVAFHALWQHHIARGDFEVAMGIAQTMLEIANTDAKLAHANRSVGECYFYMGKLSEAKEHLDHPKIAKFTKDDWDDPLGLDTKAAAYSHACVAQAISGEIDLAFQTAELAISRAEEIEHRPSIIFANHCGSVMEVVLRNFLNAQRKAEKVLKLEADSPFPLFQRRAKLVIGWASLQSGEKLKKREILEPFSESRDSLARASRPFWLSLIAECLGSLGEHWFAMYVLDDALEMRGDTGDTFQAAEVHRIRADTTRPCYGKERNAATAEQYKQAIDNAHHQGAYLYQLRAAVAYHEQATRKSDRQYCVKKIKEALKQITGSTPEVKAAKQLLTSTDSQNPKRPR